MCVSDHARTLKENWYCGKKGININQKYLRRHNCLARRKGNNKGRKCPYLIKIRGEA